jgi:peptide/nickel transport system permease protein
MGKYIVKRLFWMIPVILGVTVLIFTIMFFVPGDPVAIMLGSNASPDEIAQARELLGLNKSYLERLLNYVSGVVFRFDLGTSYQYGSQVTADLLERFPRTVMLALCSMLIAVAFGIPLGVTAATHQDSLSDRVSMLIAMFGVSIPAFWLAQMLVLLFSLKLGWLPSYGIGGIKYYILPAISNSFAGLAGIARQTRSSVLECIRADYVTTAKAKGLSGRKVLMGHILPNSLIPIVTYAGSRFSMMLGGAIVIENVFSIPGVGTYMVQAINYRDYGAVQGSVIFCAISFSIIMLLVDLIYAYIDPRIKAQYEGKRRRKKDNG